MGRRGLWFSLALGVGLMAYALSAAADPWPGTVTPPRLVEPVWSLAGSCEPLDFDSIDIEWYDGRGLYVLTVRGTKPYTNMEVSLSHKGYSSRPAYWQTVVVGCVKNFLVLPIASPYHVTMPLDRFVGSKGVEIIGASGSARREVPRPR
jgi:hypothetical protein